MVEISIMNIMERKSGDEGQCSEDQWLVLRVAVIKREKNG